MSGSVAADAHKMPIQRNGLASTCSTLRATGTPQDSASGGQVEDDEADGRNATRQPCGGTQRAGSKQRECPEKRNYTVAMAQSGESEVVWRLVAWGQAA